MIVIAQINPKIFIAKFKNNHELASTFLRFQEYYEHSKFRNKTFTLDQFKKWYISKHKKFNYYNSYDGFNIPSNILIPFYNGKFNPLSKKEN